MRVTFSQNGLTAGQYLAAACSALVMLVSGSAWAETPVVELTVPGERLRRAEDAPGTSSSVVERAELQQPGQSSADVLRSVPGIQVARTGASSDFATASLRGATSEQTPIYLGGVRLNDDVGGTADLSATPLWILDRIVIYRGHAPDYVDRLGVGGALVLHPRLPISTELRLGAGLGSHGEQSQWVSAAASSSQSAALVGLKLSGATNDYRYSDDQGTLFDPTDDRALRRRNADFASVDFWAISRHRLGKGLSVRTVFNSFQREQGINGLSISPALHARVTQRRLLAGVTLDLNCGENCEFTSTTQALVGRSVTEDPRKEISALLTPLLDVDGKRLSQRFALSYDAGPVRLSPSVWLGYEQTAVTRVPNSSLEATRSSVRPALTADTTVGPGRAYGLIALECHRTDSAGDRGERPPTRGELCEEAEPIGRVGAEVTVGGGTRVLLSAGRYVRMPTVGERFGTSPVVRGNDALKVERSFGVDAGLRSEQRWRELTLGGELATFARVTDDLIGFRQTSLGIVRPFNIATARNVGAEAALNAEFFQHWQVSGNATWLDPRDTSPGRTGQNDQLPYRSRLVTTLGTELHGKLDSLNIGRASLGLEYFRRAARFADSAGLVVLPAEGSVDLTAAVTFWRERLNLGFAVRNLTDEFVVDLLGAPLPGRSAHLSIEATLGP
ncbi:MAG: hypothetical protein RJA70_514 [Pseudomonadota bacterium]|jgi:iron complex outermembrane receptor protein